MSSDIKTYMKLPIPVKAIKVTGTAENIADILWWSKTHSMSPVYTPISIDDTGWLVIKTLEGDMRPKLGDYVVQGPEGECWFVNGPIFEKTYYEVVNG